MKTAPSCLNRKVRQRSGSLGDIRRRGISRSIHLALAVRFGKEPFDWWFVEIFVYVVPLRFDMTNFETDHRGMTGNGKSQRGGAGLEIIGVWRIKADGKLDGKTST